MPISDRERKALIKRIEDMIAKLDPDGAARRAAADREAWRLLGEPGTDSQRALADDYRRASEQARDHLNNEREN